MDPRLSRAEQRWKLTNPRPVAGEPTTRQYFRVDQPQLGTALVVLHPLDQEGEASYFEFRALQAYLDPLLRVPTILHSDDEDRCLLVEDLGSTSLEQRLVACPEEEQTWGHFAGLMLATLAGPLSLGAPGHAFFMERSFDQPALANEWQACRQHFFQEFLQRDPPRWLDRMMEDVNASLETRAHFFTHCGFHVRNLMVHGDRLVVIAFQDARRGPATYDLASLLFDAHWDWSKEAGRALMEPLRQELGWSQEALVEELNLSALQRTLKSLGVFGHHLVHLNQPQMASALLRTLRHLRGHFQRLHHQDGVLACEHMLRLAEERFLKG